MISYEGSLCLKLNKVFINNRNILILFILVLIGFIIFICYKFLLSSPVVAKRRSQNTYKLRISYCISRRYYIYR